MKLRHISKPNRDLTSSRIRRDTEFSKLGSACDGADVYRTKVLKAIKIAYRSAGDQDAHGIIRQRDDGVRIAS
jgi:hypothetical protein